VSRVITYCSHHANNSNTLGRAAALRKFDIRLLERFVSVVSIETGKVHIAIRETTRVGSGFRARRKHPEFKFEQYSPELGIVSGLDDAEEIAVLT